MKRLLAAFTLLVALPALLISSAGAGATTTPKSYLIVAKGDTLPSNLATEVAKAGGTLTSTVPQVGIAVASSTSSSFKTKAAKLGTVLPDLNVQWVDPVRVVAGPEVFGNPPASGDDDFFFDLQWGHDAVDAPEAWNAGGRGAGARVAVLDTGFDLAHPDLAPNINLGLSVDMTGEGLNYTLPDVFSHGTHTAGTVAAADNAFGTIGVAPLAELVLVKVLTDEGSGSFDDIIAGIVHAADADADVISMSLGARIVKSGEPDHPTDPYTAKEAAELKKSISRATKYAHRLGSTVVASAGNDGEDYDKNGNVIQLPSDSHHVLSISATGPLGWGVDPSTDLDVPAFYTNFGKSSIDFAAPGGNVDFDLGFPDGPPFCTVGLAADVPCWVFDLVFSTGNGGWFWSAGTSMAAPHAAGVAAIIIGANGGSLDPDEVEDELQASADDLGDPGKDPFYGLGRVNAGNAAG